jgi:hypothetical protein
VFTRLKYKKKVSYHYFAGAGFHEFVGAIYDGVHFAFERCGGHSVVHFDAIENGMEFCSQEGFDKSREFVFCDQK